MKFTFIDLFAGIGGFRIAFERNGGKCVFSSEIDSFCCKVYEHNFGEKPSGDITKIEAKDIPDFDILCGGFPCQPFSYSGKLEGFNDKTRGTLFFDIVRILKEKKPKMFLLENVKGLKSHDNGKTLKIIEEQLTGLGYHIHEKILNSNDFGVPQKRERWFCVGFLEDVPFEFPEPTKKGTVLRDIVDVDLVDPKLNLTPYENQVIDEHFASNEVRVKHDNSMCNPNSKKGKYGIYSYLKPDNSLRFHVGDVAKTQIQEMFYCSLDCVSPAIIATREPKLWDLRRRLSTTECKRLQGFPEEFEFNVSDLQAKKQLGNAVAVPCVEAIAKNMVYYYELFKKNK